MKKTKVIGMLIIGIILGSIIGTNAATLIQSNQVIYKDNETVDVALNNLFDELKIGKTKLAEAITSKGVKTTSDKTLDEMANNINQISSSTETILYDSGVEGGFELDYSNYLGAPTAYNKITPSKSSSSILINLNNGNCAGGFGTNEKIDITNYSKLYAIVQIGTTISKVELDLTDINGEYYVGFSAHNASSTISGAISLWETSKTQGWPTYRASTPSINIFVGSTVVTDFYKINVIKLWME